MLWSYYTKTDRVQKHINNETNKRQKTIWVRKLIHDYVYSDSVPFCRSSNKSWENAFIKQKGRRCFLSRLPGTTTKKRKKKEENVCLTAKGFLSKTSALPYLCFTLLVKFEEFLAGPVFCLYFLLLFLRQILRFQKKSCIYVL